MSQFVDINDRAQLSQMLHSLDAGAKPLWGKMKPQQMVEHLIWDVGYTNGKRTVACTRSAEDTARDKQKDVFSDKKIAKNVNLGDLPEKYDYADYGVAVTQLMAELDDFDVYFKEPGATAVHFWYGPLDHHEWLIWHGKHFTHHLTQFGLWPE